MPDTIKKTDSRRYPPPCNGRGRRYMTRNIGLSLLCCAAAVVLPGTLMAVGTPSGTTIVNQATLTYNVGPAQFSVNSNTTIYRVAELLDVNVQWRDAAPISVYPGDTAQVTTFIVSNTGNGADTLLLEIINRLDGDTFDPIPGSIFLDTNANGLYDPESDLRYSMGVNDPVLNADASIIVFALNDFAADLPDGSRGNTQLLATTSLGTGPPGTQFPGQGDFGMDAVLGAAGGDDSDIGVYVVLNAAITLNKSVTIRDMFGGSEPATGATLSYSIVLTASGSGVARQVTILDTIPANTTYSPGTLTLDSNPLTDEADEDRGDVGRTHPGVVTVNLGDIAIPSQEITIRFDVTIN